MLCHFVVINHFHRLRHPVQLQSLGLLIRIGFYLLGSLISHHSLSVFRGYWSLLPVQFIRLRHEGPGVNHLSRIQRLVPRNRLRMLLVVHRRLQN